MRLELARAFFLKHEDTLARLHFEQVLAGDVPPAVAANIQRFLRARRRWQAHSWRWRPKAPSWSRPRARALAQPTISLRIAILEKTVGARLFERGGRGKVQLTRTGQGLLPYAREVVAAHNRMVKWHDSHRGFRRLW